MIEDIVLIKGEENVPRTQWRIGKINKLVIRKDAQAWGAELVVISETGEKTVCQRPTPMTVRGQMKRTY